jgi:two-component system chemotaxis response regulator CheY
MGRKEAAMANEKRRRTILIVDDEAAIRELLKLELATAGYEVVLAEDALGAARLVREAKPDLMIVDAHMPYVSGLDFVSAVITDSSMPWVPVIFITGRSELRNDAESLGSACLVKPFLAARLVELIERVVGAQERLTAVAGLVERKALGAA